MIKRKKYRSFSCNLFNVWRLGFVGFIVLAIFIGIVQSAVFVFIFLVLVIGMSYSEVSYDGSTVRLRNISKTIELSNLKSIQTWWTYDFGRSTPIFGDGYIGEMRAHINKMNCYVKMESANDCCYIYEQIHLSEKFPSSHKYLQDMIVDQKKLVKVWDIDKCLLKLGLDQYMTGEFAE